MRIKARMDNIGTRINKLKAKKGCATEHFAKKSLGASLSLDSEKIDMEKELYLTPKSPNGRLNRNGRYFFSLHTQGQLLLGMLMRDVAQNPPFIYSTNFVQTEPQVLK